MNKASVIRLFCIAALAAIVGGCNIIAAPIVLFTPPKKVEAQYTLDPQSRVMVLVESAAGQLPYPPFKGRIGELVGRTLYKKYLVDSVVPQSQVRSVVSRLDNSYAASGGHTSLDAMAKAAGADAVIYIEIRSFQMQEYSSTASLWTPKCTLAVKVVDADGKLLWPDEFKQMHSVSASADSEDLKEVAKSTRLAEKLAADAADKIAKLFYEYRVDPYGFK